MLEPWDPFPRGEQATRGLPTRSLELVVGEMSGMVRRPATHHPPAMPSLNLAVSRPCPDPSSGTGSRLCTATVPTGSCNGAAGRASEPSSTRSWGGRRLNFATGLDTVLHLDIAKMRVSVPPQLRQRIEEPIHQLAIRADAPTGRAKRSDGREAPDRLDAASRAMIDSVLRSAAIQAGITGRSSVVLDVMRETSPELLAEMA